MKKQLGVSLSGFIIVCVVLIFVALLGFKMFTPYMQYFAVQKTLKVLAQNPELRSGNRREIAGAFQRYQVIDNITAIGSDDIEISKDGNEITLSASYSVKVPLVANISLLIDFAPTSTSK